MRFSDPSHAVAAGNLSCLQMAHQRLKAVKNQAAISSSVRVVNIFLVRRSTTPFQLWCRTDAKRSFSYSVQPIFDPTPKQDGGFDARELEKFILTPKQWNVAHGFSGRRQSGWGAIFIAGGVVVTLIQPRLSAYKERQRFYLLSNDRFSRIRPVDMWKIPYLPEFLRYAVYKEKA
jgi:hypothetical protein